jgi:alkaline phosphatase D
MGNAKLTPVRLKTASVSLAEETDFVAQFTVGLLEPGRTYGYRVMINGKEQKVPQELKFKTQALWQWRTDPPDWKMAFGSCAFVNETRYDRLGRPYGGVPEDKRIYASMAGQSPDLTVWGGDYLYFREVDEDSELGLRYRWRYDRGTPEQQVLLRTGSHVSIWDDHEYGPNDGNSSYRLKGEALTLFKRYWANPSFGLPELPGTFTTYRFNDAELFMLDNRYYRDADELQAKDKTKLGAGQLRWLKNALLMSVSPVKLIVAGSQVTNDASTYDGWHNFPEERADILKFLVDHKINGVIFMTGDRHFTE